MSDNIRPELTKLLSQPEFRMLIQCPVCKEVPFPPIYLCTTGHSICKSCKPKLTECPLCKGRFSDARNKWVEDIILASTHSCAYKEDGCELEAVGELLCDHIRICQCRSFVCPGKANTTGCAEILSIKSSQAKEHFCAKHGAQTPRTMPSLPLTVTNIPLLFTRVDPDHSRIKQGNAWTPSVLEFQGKDFLCQIYTRKNIFYWTIFCIGTEEEARKYSAKIMFYSYKQESARIHWEVPVQPIIKCEELRRSNEMKAVIIPSCNFDDFKKIALRDDNDSQYLFHTEYKISKRE